MKIIKICPVCQTSFTSYSCQNRLCCSWACADKNSRVTKICPICNREFVVRKSNIKKKTCSLECANKFKGNLFRGKTLSERWGSEEKAIAFSNIIKARKGFKHTQETKEKISLNSKGKPKHTEESKNKISQGNKGKKRTEEQRLNISLGHLGLKCSKETRLKMSLAHKGKQKTQQHIKNLLRSITKNLNGFELKVLALLNKAYPGQFRYVGDGSYLVDNKSADFINKTNKVVVLAHGIYWHLITQ